MANVLTGTEGPDELYGTAGDDEIHGLAGDDWFDGGAGADVLVGGAGNDWYIIDQTDDVVIEQPGEGWDVIYTYLPTYSIATLSNVEGIVGSESDNTLVGNDYANLLNGWVGADQMIGGLGDDYYLVDNIGDIVTELVGEGQDTISTALSTFSIENLEFVENLLGSEADDSLIGNSGDNAINGRLGADMMMGLGGNDKYYVDNAQDIIFEALNSGFDVLNASVDFVLSSGAEVEVLRVSGPNSTSNVALTGNEFSQKMYGSDGVNSLSGAGGDDILFGYGADDRLDGGAGDDQLRGGDGDDSLAGGVGNDSLYGGTGDDVMAGGLGDDLYQVDSVADATQEGSGQGTDTVQSSVTWSLRNNFEILELTGAAAINGTGNALANTITGNDGANLLSGGSGGADQLFGEGGDDRLTGGTGNDRLDGGSGRDILYGGLDADTFVFKDGDFAGLTTTTADKIVDFSLAQGDTLDLTGVDGDSLTGGLQDLQFIGTAAFSSTAGELRYEMVNGNTYVTGDTDGDGVADFMFWMTGSHALTSGDIVI